VFLCKNLEQGWAIVKYIIAALGDQWRSHFPLIDVLHLRNHLRHIAITRIKHINEENYYSSSLLTTWLTNIMYTRRSSMTYAGIGFSIGQSSIGAPNHDGHRHHSGFSFNSMTDTTCSDLCCLSSWVWEQEYQTRPGANVEILCGVVESLTWWLNGKIHPINSSNNNRFVPRGLGRSESQW